MKNYFKLLQFLRDHIQRFCIAVFFIILSSLFEGLQFTLMLPVIDRIFTNQKIVAPAGSPHFVNQLANYFNSIDSHVLFYAVPLVS